MSTIWYAAYGSNLSRARFDCYLVGGCPSGSSHVYPGCRDASPPLEDVAVEIDVELAFGGVSTTWGGGVAFVRAVRDVPAKARLYRITLDQFADIVAQENWLEPGTVELRTGSKEVILDGGHMYRRVIELGERGGAPVLAVSQPADTDVAAPSSRYLRHIADGLREAHGMTTDEIVDYLGSAPGVQTAELSAAVS